MRDGRARRSTLGHVLNQSKQLTEVSCALPRDGHSARHPQAQLVAQILWCSVLVQLLRANGLKPDLERLRMIQCQNTNPLTLVESRVRPEQWTPGTGHALQNRHFAVTYRFPNLTRTRKYKVGRQ